MTKDYLTTQFRNFLDGVVNPRYVQPSQIATQYKGKNVVHMGDSWIELYNLAELSAQKVGYNVTNCGFQSTCISGYSENALLQNARKMALIRLAEAIRDNVWTEQDEAVVNTSWAAQLAKLKAVDWAHTDLLILSYGVNDYGAQNPIGDTKARDTESVCGALKNALAIFQTINPNMQIVITTPCYRHRNADDGVMTALSEQTPLEEYRNAIGLTAYDCGVRLVDMRALSGINEANRTTTLLSDGLHPTELGQSMWVDGFTKALVNGYGGAFDISNDFAFEDDNICFDSEQLTKHKQWNATYTVDGIKYMCTSRNQQFGDAIMGMKHFDTLPVGTTIAITGYGRKIGSNSQRVGFYIKNGNKTSTLIEKYSGSLLGSDDAVFNYSFTTTEAYSDCWVIPFVKQMTTWENGKALVRNMKCTVTLP